MVLVAGIGQSLRGDDAAGLLAVRSWAQAHPDTASHPNVRVEVFESPGIELAQELAAADAAVLVDAVFSSATPGGIRRLTSGEIGSLLPTAASAHGWGIPEALRMASALGRGLRRGRLTVLGIEAAQMQMGSALSPAVENAMPTVAAAIEAEVRAYLDR